MIAKILFQANLCCLLQLGIGTKIHLKMLLIEFLPLSDHHSHFWAANFDFTTFSCCPFCMGCPFFTVWLFFVWIFFYTKIDLTILPRLGLASYLFCILLHSQFGWIFFYTKIDPTILPRLGLASYLCCLLLHLLLTTKRHPSDVEPSYIPIFRLIQSAVYCVGMSKDCTCFTQMIDYNSKDLVRILLKIDTDYLWMPYRMYQISAWLENKFASYIDFFKCACKKWGKNSKVCSLISRKNFTQFSSNLVCSLPW